MLKQIELTNEKTKEWQFSACNQVDTICCWGQEYQGATISLTVWKIGTTPVEVVVSTPERGIVLEIQPLVHNYRYFFCNYFKHNSN